MNFKKKCYKFIARGLVILGLITGAINNAVAYAVDFDFLTDGTGNGAFNEITKTLKDTGASAYQLMMVVGAIGLVFSTIALGISIAATKNSSKKSENKSHLPAIAGGGMLVFGAIALVGLIQSIAQSL